MLLCLTADQMSFCLSATHLAGGGTGRGLDFSSNPERVWLWLLGVRDAKSSWPYKMWCDQLLLLRGVILSEAGGG